MYPNQPPVYTTRHYNYNPTGQSSYAPSHSSAYDGVHQPPSYPYYSNNPQPQANYYGSNYPPPTTVTYVNDRSNYAQAQTNSYVPPNSNRYPPNNNNSYPRSTSLGPPIHRQGQTGGGIEKTNNMSNENPFYDPGRSSYEPMTSSRTSVSITAQAKSDGSVNKTLNLSDENPFHSIYGGYQYSAQIDPSKRITTQNTAARSTDNKSLNLSEENPFFSIYGGYHYPSQIDPSKRITEMPKAAGPLMPTNDMSNDNPFNPYQAPPARHQIRSMNDGPPPPLSYRPMAVQRPAENYYDPPAAPPPPPAPVRRTQSPPAVRNQPARPSGPLDKTSLNMSPDNPFAETYGNYYYPSTEEIKTQKRANNRINEQRAFNESRPVAPAASNPMTEYPEPENKEVISGKGQTKFTRFDVNF